MVICGLDEVGRGCLAGPLVAAGVVFKENGEASTLRLRDSKKLSKKQRRKLYNEIFKVAEIVELSAVSVRQINLRGIGWANKEVFRRLILKIQSDKYVVDGNLKLKVRGKSAKIVSMVKADQKVCEVMAASIVAKVVRDELMQNLHTKFPKYRWNENAGYGTKAHIKALVDYGVVYHHRKQFVETALRHGIEVESK